MTAQDIKNKDHQYLAQTYNRFDLVLSKGSGCEVWDMDGKHYLDFTAGIGTNSLGFCDEHWVSAVMAQVQQLQHTSNVFYTAPATKLAERLITLSQLRRAFFCNSGAEANECAIKTARKYSLDNYGLGRHTVLTLCNSFHGRTISTLAATGQPAFQQHFFPFTQGFEHLPSNDISALTERLKKQDVCAVMLEIVQGEGGILPLSRDYLNELQRLCRQQDILLIIDEVQTGIGRTGKMFAYQHFNLTPDLVSLAKGLGGGLPIGAVLFGKKCEYTIQQGEHGSTFGANPVCCAGANAVLDRLTRRF